MKIEKLERAKEIIKLIEKLKKEINEIDLVEFDINNAGGTIIYDDYKNRGIQFTFDEIKPLIDKKRIDLKKALEDAEKEFEEL